MPSELGRRAMLGNNENSFGDEFEKEIGFLLQRRQEGDDLEKELNLYRSGSAPPTVDGSLNAVGGLFNHGGNGFVSEEEIRSHPSYLSHYYSNVNMNPRLPPPLLSREDWRLAQRLQGGNSAIGDRRNKQEIKDMDSVEWGGDGLIGLPGIGLDSRQKSLAEIFKDDLSHNTLVSPHASRPASRNAIDENTNAMGSNLSYSYAAALGASVSRTSTPDPQLIARAASPCPTPIGGGRVRNSEKRNVNNGVSSLSKEAADLVSTLSGLNLSNGVVDDGSRLSYHIEPNPNSHNNYPFNLEGGRNNSNFGQAEPQKFVLQSNNSYGKRSPYQHLGSPNSSFSNYGSGYPISPISGQLGSSNSPLLFDNAAAAFGIDSKIANQMGGNVQPPFVDPSYLHYLNGGEFSAPPLNDPTFNRNSYLGDSYMDLLHKAYIGNYLPVGGKSGLSSPNGYYGSPPFGIGLSYPDSAGGPYSPIRHGGFNMAFPSFGSSLLEEFKSNKAKCMELSDIAGHVVEFSTDQYGSRFIQQKLETATIEEKNMVFEEILPQALMLITGVFGNYVVQKFFEHGLASQRRELADKLIGHVLTLSLQMYGCRVIQKAIEVVDVYQKIKMVGELDGHVMQCVRDQNGNHVIQKCIECIPEEHIQFIVSTFFNQVVTLSTHPYGCRVIQRVLEHCEDEKTQKKVMDEILGSVSLLAQDQYGNYVVQHVLEHGKPHERSTIIRELAGKIVQMSQQKFASNVVEKCLTFGDPSERQFLVTEMLGTTDENEPLQAMMKDQFANYVVQKVLETCSDQQRELIMCRIKIHLNALKKYTYGKHIVARVEKLVAAGERRIAASAAAAAAAQAPNAA